jgi:hypothetical protein
MEEEKKMDLEKPPPPVASVPVAPPQARKSGPIKNPLDVRALARSAGVMIGLGPRDSKFLLDYLISAQDNTCDNLVCIRCGAQGLKKNSITPCSPLGLVINLKEASPRMGFLLGHTRNLKMEPRIARDDCVIVNGLCRRCQLDMGSCVPSVLRVPKLDDDDADQLRMLVVELCLQGKACDAYERLKPLLD